MYLRPREFLNAPPAAGKGDAVEDVKVAFDDLDSDGDGFIDVTEAKVMADFVNEESGVTTQPEKTTAKPNGYTAKQIIDFMDKDSDGKIAKDEASEQLKLNFQYLDTNGDGFLDLKESEVMVEYANKGQ